MLCIWFECNMNVYIFRLFECLQWLDIVSNIWCFMCLNVKNEWKEHTPHENVHLDFMIEYIITKYGIMKWHEKIF